MSLSKVELKKQLQAMGIKIKGNYVKKKDIDKYMSLAAESIHFSSNTDTVDIDAKSLGVHPMPGFNNRGLCIQIRHNRNKELFDIANKMAKIIQKALNDANLPAPAEKAT